MVNPWGRMGLNYRLSLHIPLPVCGNKTVSPFPVVCHFLPPLIPCFYQAEREGGEQEQLWSWVMKEFPTRW